MKKILSMLLLVFLLFAFTACGTSEEIAESYIENTEIEVSSVVSSEDESDSEIVSDVTGENSVLASDSEVESSDEDIIPENASEYAIEFYNRYKELSADNGFKVSDLTVSRDWTEFSLIFDEYENQFKFYKDEKSFNVYIDNKLPASDKKNAIAKILMGLDDISIDKSKNLSQDIANSYSPDNFSDTIDIGDYLVVLNPEFFNNFTILSCRSKENIWEEFDKTEYPDIDPKMYKSPELNIGEKCKITGIVIDWYINEVVSNTYEGVAVVKTDDGSQYNCTYLYEYNPIKLEIGKRYTIYGSIGRDLDYNGEISINYPEKIN